MSNDIHQNPGPLSNDDTSVSSYHEVLCSGLSILNLNIQSLRPKIDILEIEAHSLTMFLSSLNMAFISNECQRIPNLSTPFRCDRIGRVGGGFAVYVRNGLACRERTDVSIIGLEALWFELIKDNRKLLVGGFNRPPDSNNNYWSLFEQSIEQSIEQTHNEHSDNLIITGDFNINLNTTLNNKMANLVSSYNAEQMISQSTYFTEHSHSLIDLIIVKHASQVITSFVADPFIPNLVRFHCAVVVVLKFNKPKCNTYKRRIWLYDRGDYGLYNEKLASVDWDTWLNNENTKELTNNVTNKILQVAQETIPNKQVTIRPSDNPWMKII